MGKKEKGAKAAEDAEFNALLKQLSTVSKENVSSVALVVTAVDAKKGRQKKLHHLKEAKVEAEISNRVMVAQIQKILREAELNELKSYVAPNDPLMEGAPEDAAEEAADAVTRCGLTVD